MFKSFNRGIAALALVAATTAGFAMPASADYYVNPYARYSTGYYTPNYVTPYYVDDYGYRSSTRRYVKPALIGAGVGGLVGLGVSALQPRHRRHTLRNVGIGAGVGAGVGLLGGLLDRDDYYY